MHENKGNLSINSKESRIESLAEDIVRGDFYRIGPLTTDACRLLVQFCAEGHLATREEYDESERKRQCDWAVETAAEAIFVDILPEVFTAVVYGQEGEEEWMPVPDADEVSIIGLTHDILMVYLEGLPFAVSIFTSDEYYPDPEDEYSEEIKISVTPEHLEAIQAIYVDEGVVSQLGLSKDEVGVYLEMLVSKTLERFTYDSDSTEMFRPTITVAKNQEGYFEQTAYEFLWGKTEQEAGYIVFN